MNFWMINGLAFEAESKFDAVWAALNLLEAEELRVDGTIITPEKIRAVNALGTRIDAAQGEELEALRTIADGLL